MPGVVHWGDLALRLLLSVLAGGLIGLDRGEHGRPAGMRTVLLVCVSSCLAMILANLVMVHTGPASNPSVLRLDVMRLPLGILSGMGFIGAGAIIRRGDMILGVTTAATLWFVTVIGLCFGAAEPVVGTAGTALALGALTGLKYVEDRLPRDLRATIELDLQTGTVETEIRQALAHHGFRIVRCTTVLSTQGAPRQLIWVVTWRGLPAAPTSPAFLELFAEHPGVLRLAWKP